jgi:two-component system NarL family response regulator
MRILLVDDHALFRKGVASLLSVNQIEVVGEASDGYKAFEMARTLHPDTILMDIDMPNCDGLTATRLIKAEMPEIKIVILSIAEEDEKLFEAIRSGASGYLLKRSDSDEFLARLQSLANGDVPFSRGLGEKVLGEFARGSQSKAAATDLNEDERKMASLVSAMPISQRQVQVLTLVVQGKPYAEIGETLGLSERTVKYHMKCILEALQLENRSQVIAYCARLGFG